MALIRSAQIHWLIIFWLFITFIFHFSFGAELDFSVEVPAGRMQCFFQEITEDHSRSMQVDYQV